MKTLSDDKLREVRQQLQARGVELRERVLRVQEDLRRKREPLPKDSADAAIVVENDEILEAIASTARTELAHIEHAIERLESGVFALCESCGAEIEPERLSAVPYAARCRRCARDG